jgi:hypothetical protein
MGTENGGDWSTVSLNQVIEIEVNLIQKNF